MPCFCTWRRQRFSGNAAAYLLKSASVQESGSIMKLRHCCLQYSWQCSRLGIQRCLKLDLFLNSGSLVGAVRGRIRLTAPTNNPEFRNSPSSMHLLQCYPSVTLRNFWTQGHHVTPLQRSWYVGFAKSSGEAPFNRKH